MGYFYLFCLYVNNLPKVITDCEIAVVTRNPLFVGVSLCRLCSPLVSPASDVKDNLLCKTNPTLLMPSSVSFCLVYSIGRKKDGVSQSVLKTTELTEALLGHAL